jgi:hypothetical protein
VRPSRENGRLPPPSWAFPIISGRRRLATACRAPLLHSAHLPDPMLICPTPYYAAPRQERLIAARDALADALRLPAPPTVVVTVARARPRQAPPPARAPVTRALVKWLKWGGEWKGGGRDNRAPGERLWGGAGREGGGGGGCGLLDQCRLTSITRLTTSQRFEPALVNCAGGSAHPRPAPRAPTASPRQRPSGWSCPAQPPPGPCIRRDVRSPPSHAPTIHSTRCGGDGAHAGRGVVGGWRRKLEGGGRGGARLPV